MIELSSTEKTTIGFKINIEGSSEEPICRFFLKITEDIQLMFPAKVFEDKVIVNIPALNFLSSVKESELQSFLEVIVNGNYFKPWEGISYLKTPVRIQADLEPNNNVDIRKSKIDLSSVSAELEDSGYYEGAEDKGLTLEEDGPGFSEYLKGKEKKEDVKVDRKKSEFSDFLRKKGI